MKQFTRFLDKWKIAIIVFWIIGGSIFISFYAAGLFNNTTNDFDPGPNSEAGKAYDLFNQYFPNETKELAHIVVANTRNKNILGQDLADLTQQLITKLNNTYGDLLVSYVGYYIYAGTPLDNVKTEFISADNTTSYLAFTFTGELSLQGEISDSIREILIPFKDKMNVYSTGAAELEQDTQASVEHDLSTIDSFIVPIILIALLLLLRNWRYLLLTGTTIGLTIGVVFATLDRYIEVTGTQLQTFLPSVIVSLMIGIGVDYSLFLLTRYREERLKGQTVFDSVKEMMSHAGHTVFTSGMTLSIAIAGLAFFPLSVISSMGIGITIGVLILLAINLTLTPALLLLFGAWFERSPEDHIAKQNGILSEGMWYKIGKYATKYNFIVLFVILLLTLPIAAQLIDFTPQGSTIFYSPRNSDSSNGFALMQGYFGPGLTGPTNLVIVTNDAWSLSTVEKIQDFINSSVVTLALSAFSIQSHTWLNGTALKYYEIDALTSPSSLYYNSSEAIQYRAYASRYVSATIDGRQAALVDIILPVDPFSPEADTLLDQLKVIASDVFDGDYQYGFAGATAINQSAMDETLELFPLMLLIITLVIYVFIGIMFKSFLLPLRLIITIALTLSFIFGAATLVFEDTTILNDWLPVLNDVDVTFWMAPIMTILIIIGLGIDYDVFTIERIRENAWEGMETNEAISHGIEKTGRIITGAGVIMMLSFGGLMLSNSYILIQFGFILAFAILLDTFVVRSLLVPAIMSFAEKWNWWPALPPHLKKK